MFISFMKRSPFKNIVHRMVFIQIILFLIQKSLMRFFKVIFENYTRVVFQNLKMKVINTIFIHSATNRYIARILKTMITKAFIDPICNTATYIIFAINCIIYTIDTSFPFIILINLVLCKGLTLISINLCYFIKRIWRMRILLTVRIRQTMMINRRQAT
jgi:hypothetical protein